MRIIHTADIHLGSQMKNKFPAEVAKKRREEIRNTFVRLADYAVEHDVQVVMLSGDVFDSDSPVKAEKDFFYSVIKNHPAVDFLYLKGNHDRGAGYTEEDIPNLKTFDTSWKTYTYGNVAIHGIEFSDENAFSLYSTLHTDPSRLNIVMLHGQVTDSFNQMGRDVICLPRLRGKNISYLALGHIHARGYGNLDGTSIYVYPGCLEGRGFDELGPHGFCLVDTNGVVHMKFVSFARREIYDLNADISGCRDAYSAALAVKKQINFNREFIYRINLVGEMDSSTDFFASSIAEVLSKECFYLIVRDQTRRKTDLSEYEKDTSLRGEFVRTVSASTEYTDEEKQMIIHLGLKVLRGEDCDL